MQVAKGLVDDTSAGGHTFAVGVDGSRLCYHGASGPGLRGAIFWFYYCEEIFMIVLRQV